MKNGDDALPGTDMDHLACRDQLAKTRINLEPHGTYIWASLKKCDHSVFSSPEPKAQR